MPVTTTGLETAELVSVTSPPAMMWSRNTQPVAVSDPVISMGLSIRTFSRTSDDLPPSALVIEPVYERLLEIVRVTPSARVMLFVLDEKPLRSIAADLLRVSSSTIPFVSSAPRKMMTSLSFSSEANASLRLPNVKTAPSLSMIQIQYSISSGSIFWSSGVSSMIVPVYETSYLFSPMFSVMTALPVPATTREAPSILTSERLFSIHIFVLSLPPFATTEP